MVFSSTVSTGCNVCYLLQGYVKVGCPVTAAVGGGAAIALTGGSAAPVAVPGAIALATTCGVVAATNQCDKIGRRKRSGQIEVCIIFIPITMFGLNIFHHASYLST